MKNPRLDFPFHRTKVVKQFILFSGVGVLGTIAHYATLITLVQAWKANAVLASCAGFILGALVNYYFNYRLTFRSNKRHSETATKFFTVALVGFISNALIMSFSLEILHLLYIPAQIAATGIILFWNFTANRLWTFRERIQERE